jgi:stage III sporulation protein AB
MLKFLGAIILISSGFAIGNYKVMKLKKKLIFLESFKDFIAFVKSEIKYSLSSPEKIINDYQTNTIFKEYIKKCRFFMNKGFNFSQSWKEVFDSDFIGLGDSERIVKKFGAEFGSADIENQIALCDLTLERLSPCIENTLKELTSKRKIFFTVGACAGIAMSILLF